ncbi:MAG: hypothetical protein KUG64_10670 [Cycloclasticus sp.]|nr:hypothetical protein [Cycloclasticus sp.]
MKNNIAIFLSIVGTGTGSFGAYTAYHADLFKQPLDKHTQVALSFKDEIASAENRGDNKKVKSLRIKYEEYEKSWRDGQLLERITASIRSLNFKEISDSKKAEISTVLNEITGSYAYATSSPEAIGAAYYAIGDFSDASEQLGIALAENPDNNNIRALQAASLVSAAKSSHNNAAALRMQAAELVENKNLNLTNKQKLFLLNTNDDSIRMMLK